MRTFVNAGSAEKGRTWSTPRRPPRGAAGEANLPLATLLSAFRLPAESDHDR
jgi:hypothetical protein